MSSTCLAFLGVTVGFGAAELQVEELDSRCLVRLVGQNRSPDGALLVNFSRIRHIMVDYSRLWVGTLASFKYTAQLGSVADLIV